MSENEIMNDRLEQLDDSLDDPNTMVAKKYFHAQLQLEQLQEENFRYEIMTLKHPTLVMSKILRISGTLPGFSISIFLQKLLVLYILKTVLTFKKKPLLVVESIPL